MGEILNELTEIMREQKAPFDVVRRKYLKKLSEHTGRNTILYASNWTQPSDTPSEMISIIDEDVQGFMEVISGLPSSDLDLIIHNPGGSAESTEAIVRSMLSSRP
jgi:ClpP class serine protease